MQPTTNIDWAKVLEWAKILLPFVIGIPTALWAFIQFWDRRSRLEDPLVIISAARLDPKLIADPYGARGFKDYWPIAADKEIHEALRMEQSIVLVGRPHVGKSRAAAYHIKTAFRSFWPWKKWYVVIPKPEAIEKACLKKLKRRRYILLLDDVDRFLGNSATSAGPVPLIAHLKRFSTKLVVVATLRNFSPGFEKAIATEYLLDRWRRIEVRDWPDEAGQKLAAHLKSDTEYWDGTPLSVIQPSNLMADRYIRLPDAEKAALRMMHLFLRVGLPRIPTGTFIGMPGVAAFGASLTPDQIRTAIESISKQGFLSEYTNQFVVPYRAYITELRDFLVEDAHIKSLIQHLDANKRHKLLFSVGSALARDNQLALAKVAIQAAIQHDPSAEAYHYRLGTIDVRNKRWADAEVNFKKAIELAPGWQTAHYRLAYVYRKQGKDDLGFEAFRKAQSLSPKNIEERVRLALVHRSEGRPDQCIDEVNEILRTSPDHAPAWNLLGRALRDKGKMHEAIDAFDKAIALEPNCSTYWFTKAEPLNKINDLAGAEEAYRKAIALGPSMPDVYTYFSKLLERTGRDSEAEKVLKDGLDKFPDSPRLNSFFGTFLSRKSSQRNEEALGYFEKAVEISPSYVEALIGLAAQYRILNRDGSGLEKAISCNLRALEFAQDIPEIYFGLGLCYLEKGAKDTAFLTKANEAFDRALALRPTWAPANFHKAITLTKLKRFRQATEFLKKAHLHGYSEPAVSRWLRQIENTLKKNPSYDFN